MMITTLENIQPDLHEYFGAPKITKLTRIYLKLYFWWYGPHYRRIFTKIRTSHAKIRSKRMFEQMLLCPDPFLSMIPKQETFMGVYLPIPMGIRNDDDPQD